MTRESLNTAETEAKHELDNPDFFNLLNGAGNHEAKLLTVSLMAAFPDRKFTRGSLRREMLERQGDEIAWNMGTSAVYDYCERSLEPIGAVVKGSVASSQGPRSTFQITEFGEQWGLPFAGYLLDWSLKYPDFSLQRVFGGSASATEKRSPEARFHIIDTLLPAENEGTELRLRDLAKKLESEGLSYRIVEEHIKKLSAAGITQAESVRDDDFNPAYIINEEYFRTEPKRFTAYSPERKLIHKALKEISDNGLREIYLKDLLDACMADDQAKEVNIYKLRSVLVRDTTLGRHDYLGFKVADRAGGPLSFNRINLEEEWRKPLEDLITGLNELKTGHGLEHYKKRAASVIDDPAVFSKVIEKARDNSAYIKAQTGGHEDNIDVLLSLVSEIGAISLKEAQAEMKSRGVNIGRTAMLSYFNDLESSGLVKGDLVKRDPAINKATTLYSVTNNFKPPIRNSNHTA
jgi:DNA-binding transcriptional ArsR family regulator